MMIQFRVTVQVCSHPELISTGIMGDPIFEIFRFIAILKNISHVFDTPGKLSKSSLKDYKNPRQIREKVCNKLYTDFGVYEKSEHKGFQKTQSDSVTYFELFGPLFHQKAPLSCRELSKMFVLMFSNIFNTFTKFFDGYHSHFHTKKLKFT